MELALNNHIKGFHALKTECMKYQNKPLNVFVTVERGDRVKFTCVLVSEINGKVIVKIAKLAVIPTGDIVISYSTKPGQEVEIRFNNLEVIGLFRYLIETVRAFNPKKCFPNIDIWRLDINLNTTEFDYIEETKIVLMSKDDRVKTHMYRGEYAHKSFKPTDTLNLRTITDKAFKAMQFQPKPQTR